MNDETQPYKSNTPENARKSMTTSPLPPQPNGNDGNTGAIVAAILIVAIIALGGYYIWDTGIQKVAEQGEMSATESQSDEDPMTAELRTQANSDALSSIEEDLENTELDAIDQELTELERDI